MLSTNTLLEVWPKALSLLQNTIKRSTLAKWIPDFKGLSFANQLLTIEVPSPFVQHWLEEKASKIIEIGLSDHFGYPITVLFVTAQLSLLLDEKQHDPLDTLPAAKAPAARRDDDFSCIPLNPRYTFDNFVVGKNSEMAHAAALSVSKMSGRSYNPLFIYGGFGFGKTHLMQAIGHAALQADRNLRVNYVSGDTFTYHVVSSIREDRFGAFRDAYRDVDIWLVDDIQFIASRERTESEFFQTFNTLYETGKQIIITSDRPPKDLQILNPRLLTRFEWGLMTDIKAPDLETRMAILEKRAIKEGAHVPEEVIRYVATTINYNIRSLEGALVKLIAASSFTNEEITLALAVEHLRDHSTAGTGEKMLSIHDVQQLVSEHFHISLEDLNGDRRTQNFVLPRQVAMYLCRELLNSSFPEIGRQFGKRDHSTVMYACNKLEQTIKIDRQIKAVIGELTSRLQEALH